MRNLVDVFRLEEKLRLSADFGDITHFVVDEDGHYMFISGTSLRIACASASTGEVRSTRGQGNKRKKKYRIKVNGGCNAPRRGYGIIMRSLHCFSAGTIRVGCLGVGG